MTPTERVAEHEALGVGSAPSAASAVHVVLVGAMGAGKTSVGRMLAERLGLPFLDSDESLEATVGDSAAAVAAREGVARLHELELATFLRMCKYGEPSVVAAAASVVESEEGQSVMMRNFTIWLQVSEKVALERQQGGDGHRRAVDPVERAALRERRLPLMEEVASLAIQTDPLSISQVVDAVFRRLPDSFRAPKTD